jgi:hypothetical protein
VTASFTGAMAGTGIVTAASVSGVIPGGGASQLTLQLQVSSSGGSLISVYFAAGFGPLTLGSGATNHTTLGAGGTGYVNGTYTNVPLVSQLGVATGVLATIIVALGIVTSCVITNGGQNNFGPIQGSSGTYADNFTTPNSNLGGSGSGFYINTNAGGISSLASTNIINIDAYGTGGTTGSGGAGTYQTTAGGAAVNPTTIVGNVAQAGAAYTVLNANWYAWPSAPPTTYSPPLNQMQPVPNVAIASAIPITTRGSYVTAPPTPLPETLIGVTAVTSSST